jgi:hypothetical protein
MHDEPDRDANDEPDQDYADAPVPVHAPPEYRHFDDDPDGDDPDGDDPDGDDPDDDEYGYHRPWDPADGPDKPGRRYRRGPRWRLPFAYAVILVVLGVTVWAVVGRRSPTTAPTVAVEASQGSASDDAIYAIPPALSDPPSPSDSPSPSLSPSPVPSRPSARPTPAPSRAALKPVPVVGRVFGGAGGCLDVRNGGLVNGTQVLEYRCHNPITSNQTWTVGSDGTLRAYGRCLRVGDDGVSTHAIVVLWECIGSPREIWRPGPNHSLVNPASRKCLDDIDGDATGDNPLELDPCNGTDEQKWTLPT